MIIFDLDGTLADCEHRWHFVDCYNYDQSDKEFIKQRTCSCEWPHASDPWIHKNTGEKWEPNWPAFYAACDKDELIEPTLRILSKLIWDYDVQIWSGRCESQRMKTVDWLLNNWFLGIFSYQVEQLNALLKMRSIGDKTPDDILKEKWLDGAIAEGKTIDFVFDSNPESIAM